MDMDSGCTLLPRTNCTHWKIDKLRRTLSRKSTKIVVLNWWQQPARTSSDEIKGFCAAIEMSWQFPVHKFTQWTFVCWKLFNLHFYNMSGSKLFSHLEFEEEKYKIICFRHLVSPIDCIVHKCHWWKWTFHFILVASLQWETNQITTMGNIANEIQSKDSSSTNKLTRSRLLSSLISSRTRISLVYISPYHWQGMDGYIYCCIEHTALLKWSITQCTATGLLHYLL